MAITEANVIKVSDGTFAAEVLNAKGAVLVDFWAPWCGPCKMMGPVLEDLSTEYKPEVLTIAKLNVDEDAATAHKYDISSIPTLLLFKDGKVAKRLMGFMPKPTLKAKLDALLKG